MFLILNQVESVDEDGSYKGYNGGTTHLEEGLIIAVILYYHYFYCYCLDYGLQFDHHNSISGRPFSSLSVYCYNYYYRYCYYYLLYMLLLLLGMTVTRAIFRFLMHFLPKNIERKQLFTQEEVSIIIITIIMDYILLLLLLQV